MTTTRTYTHLAVDEVAVHGLGDVDAVDGVVVGVAADVAVFYQG